MLGGASATGLELASCTGERGAGDAESKESLTGEETALRGCALSHDIDSSRVLGGDDMFKATRLKREQPAKTN
jgi:hypothetical protein